MQSVVNVLEPSNDRRLITLKSAKLAMNLFSTSSQSTDDQIDLMVEWASDAVADLCNRVLALERVKETLLEHTSMSPRLPLSHFPIRMEAKYPIVVTEDGTELVADTDYIIDVDVGVITKLDGSPWAVPTVVEYTGGYDLPFESPPVLQQATILLTRESYNAAIRGDSTIRSISHKETRVMYFDPNALAMKAASGGGAKGSPGLRAAEALVQGFTRYWL